MYIHFGKTAHNLEVRVKLNIQMLIVKRLSKHPTSKLEFLPGWSVKEAGNRFLTQGSLGRGACLAWDMHT